MADQLPVKYAQGMHRPFVSGDTLPPAVLALLQRIRPGNGIAIVDNHDGTLTIVNTCCDTQPPNGSIHTLTMVPVEATIVEGGNACWTITLNAPVATAALNIAFTLAGDEQTIHDYPAPVANFAIGAQTATVCVATVDDTTVELTRQLILQPVFGPRLTGWTPPGNQIDTIFVVDNDQVISTHTIARIDVAPANRAPEGTQFCWTLHLNAPVTGAPVLIPLSLDGDEQDIHHYSVSTPMVIPVGQVTAQVCVQTIDDAVIEPDRTLRLMIGTTPRIPSFPGGVVPVTVTDDDSQPPVFGAGMEGLGGMCCVTTGGVGTGVQYILQFQPNGDITQGTSCVAGLPRIGGWASGTFNPADYEIEVSLASNQGDIGGQGVWLNLGVARSFIYNFTLNAVSGGRFVTTQLTIRRVHDQQIVAGPSQVEGVQLGVNTECV